jgi:pantoate kinase
MRKAVAFAPGHISGFFQPMIDTADFRRSGSRGAGVCISLGATASVQLNSDEKQNISTRVNKKTGFFPVTTDAVKHILGSRKVNVDVDISLDLPVGQGFGMSAASALSASVATAVLIGKNEEHAIEAAHRSEICYQTGLGDVSSMASGGFEIRKKPGIAPFGHIIKITSDAKIILGLFPGSISTHDVLTDPSMLDMIASIGKSCTDNVLHNPSVEYIMDRSYYFTKKSGLCPKKVHNVLEQINKDNVVGSMCMLGHAVFILDKQNAAEEMLSNHAKIIRTSVDNEGVRILD